MKRKFLLLSLVAVSVFVSCNNKKNTPQPEPEIAKKGLFVLNEGTFTYSNSSLSFYDFDNNSVENNIFYIVNGSPIGDVGQSLALVGDNLYIVVNNGRYIYKVDSRSIKFQAKIDGFSSPRCMLPVSDGKAYVSDLASPGLWSLNLNTFEKHFIETGSATEAMVKVGDEVFVSNWSNFYVNGSNSSVQVIDCVNDTLVATIEVAKEPNSMVIDGNNHVWVLCSGGYTSPQDPALVCIDAATHQVVRRFDFEDGSYPDGLSIDGEGENIFFMNGCYGTLDVYKMSVHATEIPDTPFITSNSRVFYGLKINPQNGDIYITDAKNYVQNGDLLRYSADGTLLGTFESGLVPKYMLFN